MKNLIILILILYIYDSNAQITFNKRVAYGCFNTILTGIEATDSCYYITGFVRDIDSCSKSHIFIKYDLNGDTLLTKVLTNHSIQTYETWEPCLHTTHDGNLIVGGYTFYANGDKRALVIKYNTNGDRVWTRTFQNPLYPGEFIRIDDLIPTRDSGYLFAGQTNTPFHPADGFVVFRLDSLGNVLWYYNYPNIDNNLHQDVWQDDDGGFVIGFLQHNFASVSKNYKVECHLIKLDSLGNKLWEWTSPTGLQVLGANDLLKTKDGGWLIGSSLGKEVYVNINSNVYRDTAAYVFKLDSARNLLWETPIRPNYTSIYTNIKKLIELPDSSIWAIGQGTHIYSFQPPYQNLLEGWVVRLAANGDSLYHRKYHFLNTHASEHHVYDAELTYDNGLLISGESKGTGAGVYQQGWLLKLDEHGCLVPGCHLLSDVEQVAEEEGLAVQVALFPNPASDFINVYLHKKRDLGQDITIRLVDIQGRILQEYGQLHGDDITYVLPVSDLSVGAYVVQVLAAGEVVFVEKVLVN